MSGNWVVGITGASGAIYGVRLCQVLLDLGLNVHLIVTDAGWRVLHDELDWNVSQTSRMTGGAFWWPRWVI